MSKMYLQENSGQIFGDGNNLILIVKMNYSYIKI